MKHSRRGLLNPILVANARSRLRPKHILSWGTVTLITTAFITMMFYLTQREQGDISPATAAKATILPVIVVQSIILMLFGTSRIATAIVYEREQALIDYQRMTPMSPSARIFGYLFGLPVREYFLFLLTLPCLAFGIIVGEVPVWTILHFYVIFFTSVWLYHLTGLVAGLAMRKPRNALIISMGMVVVLYFVLPNFSHLGFTFFEFLTIRPTLLGMVYEQLIAIDPNLPSIASQSVPGLDSFRHIRLYNVDVHPSVYTLMCQGFLLVTMFVIVYRKWRDEDAHSFSKIGAVAFYTGAMFMLLGNVWPHIADNPTYDELAARMGIRSGQTDAFVVLMVILIVSLLICMGLALFLVYSISPSGYTTAKGWRLSRKLGRGRLPINSDSASGAPVTGIMVVLTAAVYATILTLAIRSGRFFDAPPPLFNLAAPILVFAFVVLTVQALRERLTGAMWMTSLFLMWALPFFCTMILWAAYEQWSLGSVIGLPCPVVSGGLAIFELFHQATYSIDATPDFEDVEFVTDAPAIMRSGVVLYGMLAIGTQLSLNRWRSTIRKRELNEEPAPVLAHAA